MARGGKRAISIFEQPISYEEPSDAEESSVGGFGQRRRRVHPASLPESPDAARVDAEKQDQVRELAELQGKLLERLDDLAKPGTLGYMQTSLGPATHNLERQSVLQHYAPRK